MDRFCEVAVNYPKRKSCLTYKVPEELELSTGQLVEVPLGRRKSTGCVLNPKILFEDLNPELKKIKTKNILSLINEHFNLSENELKLYQWMSDYYHYSLGQLIFECIPKILKRPRKIPLVKGDHLPIDITPNDDQEKNIKFLQKLSFNGFSKSLLHGITGSGKTLVYLNLILQHLEKGNSVLFLLPEINLTPQFLETFKKYLPCPILPYHSGISASEKNQHWKYLKSNPGPVLIMGVRSSVFLPIENLGMIIVDEEHDSSFKQSDRCPYNGRDVAIKKAQIHNIPVLLGSATPSLENYYQAINFDSYNYLSMPNRAGAGEPPEIEIIDMRPSGEENDQWPLWPLHQSSIDVLRRTLDNKEQSLVFINRLGFAQFVVCSSCGYQFLDPSTDMPLRYFKRQNILKSSYSEFKMPLPSMCPECNNTELIQKGAGTERVKDTLAEYFPEATIERFDRDELTNNQKLEETLSRFHDGKIDFLVGTQMLSKGHNFEKVNNVIILGIDSLLNIPDFRANERAFQMLAQISGRSGRYSNRGKVYIQTLTPDHNLFKYVKDHDLESFYHSEIELREKAYCPPFSKTGVLYFSAKSRDKVISGASDATDWLNHYRDKYKKNIQILGPTPVMIEKRAGQFTWCILLKTANINDLHQTIGNWENQWQIPSGISFKIDMDPLQAL